MIVKSKVQQTAGVTLHRALIAMTISCGGFIAWILYMANTDQDTLFFSFARMLPHGDKISHITLFGFFTLLLNLSTRCKTLAIYNGSCYLGTLAVWVFVTLEEMSQSFFPSRTVDLVDYAASLIGIVLFSFLSWLINRRNS